MRGRPIPIWITVGNGPRVWHPACRQPLAAIGLSKARRQPVRDAVQAVGRWLGIVAGQPVLVEAG